MTAGEQTDPSPVHVLPPKRRSRLFTLLSFIWLGAIWAWALAWLLAPSSWHADLLANLAFQSLLATLIALVIWLITRRYVYAALATLACLMHLWVLCDGRAAIMPLGFEPAARLPGAVRFFHYNASHKRPADEVMTLVAAAAPDVASITEPSVPLQSRIMYGDDASGVFPFRLKRMYRVNGADRIGAGVLLSRWPIDAYPLDGLITQDTAAHIIAGVLTVPASAIDATADQRWGVIAVHPKSPRSAERWAHGNEITRAVATVAAKMQVEGLPTLVLADLNSTPSGWRSRHLFNEGNLRRAKPLLTPAGTYPAWVEVQKQERPLIWPLTIAIDDAFISPDLRVRGWTRMDPAGSDHWPVVVELTTSSP